MDGKLLSIVTAAALMASAGMVSAQTTTPPMPSPAPGASASTLNLSMDEGAKIRADAKAKNVMSHKDTAIQASVGTVLPATVVLHPLPSTVTVPMADNYRYTIVNDRPVVVEQSTRRIVQSWQ